MAFNNCKKIKLLYFLLRLAFNTIPHIAVTQNIETIDSDKQDCTFIGLHDKIFI